MQYTSYQNRGSDPTVNGQRRRFSLGGLAAAFVAVGLLGGYIQHAGAKGVPEGLDYATVRMSEQAAYRVSYQSEPARVPVNQMHSWTLHVETAAGQPVTDATVKVDGDMPQHGHGLPTRPRVTRNLGNGDYLVEGMKFQMGGWWVMEFTVASGGRSDIAKFNLMLQK
jgi:hypothetical protein